MKISMKGYGENTATFNTNGIVCVTHPVKITDNYTVSPCEDGDSFAGAAVNVKNEIACVQLDGYVTFTYTGTAPDTGYCSLSANGNGGVKVDADGREYLVIDVDTINNTVGIIL